MGNGRKLFLPQPSAEWNEHTDQYAQKESHQAYERRPLYSSFASLFPARLIHDFPPQLAFFTGNVNVPP